MTSSSRKHPIVSERYRVSLMRIREHETWFPVPFMVAGSLLLLLTAHILSGTNPRTGHHAEVMVFPSQKRLDGPFWLSLSPKGKDLIISNGNREVFVYPSQSQDDANFKDLQTSLDNAIKREWIAHSIQLAPLKPSQYSVILAVDQKLTYFHLRPILQTLARLGLTQIAFETRLP